jgi:hypothetical protein
MDFLVGIINFLKELSIVNYFGALGTVGKIATASGYILGIVIVVLVDNIIFSPKKSMQQARKTVNHTNSRNEDNNMQDAIKKTAVWYYPLSYLANTIKKSSLNHRANNNRNNQVNPSYTHTTNIVPAKGSVNHNREEPSRVACNMKRLMAWRLAELCFY